MLIGRSSSPKVYQYPHLYRPPQARKEIGHWQKICRSALLWPAIVILIALGRAAPPGLASQPGSTPSQIDRQYIRTVWTSEEGLPQNSVNAIVQTRDGYLWLGTFGGLVRFDGLKFTVFNSGNTPGLKGNRILALYEDRAGTLWIGTESGEVMSLKDGQARTFTTADGLPGGLVRCFFEDQAGTLWIGTTFGLVCWQPGNVKTYTPWDVPVDNWVWAIYEDRPGHLLIGMNGGLVEFSNGRAIPRDTSGNVWAFLSSPQGSLLLGTSNGIARFVNGRLMADPRTKGLAAQSVRMMVPDRTGNLWIGYVEMGIISRWQAGASTDRLEKIDLGPSPIMALCVDREGNLWVGTRGGGLARLKERKLRAYGSEDGLSDSIRAIVDDGGDGVWAATANGLAHISGGQEPRITTYRDGLPNTYLQALYRDRSGALWFGSGNGFDGLIRFKDGAFTIYSEASGLSHTSVNAIVEDREGYLWVGTTGGLNRFRDGRFVSYRTAEGLIHNDIRYLLPAADGSLWLGTVGGLSHFHNGAFTNYTSEQGLSNNFVRTILEQSDGTLWIGTYGGGLNRFKDGRFTPVTVKDGLFDDYISQIIEDNRGRYWMLSNRGIFHVAASELNDLADRRVSAITCISYGIGDGMKSSEGNGGIQPAGCKARDGKFWFATIKGLVAIDPESSSALLPPVRIEQVVLDRQALPLGQRVRIEPGQESLEIHYTGLSFTRPEQIRFKYRLSGLDHDWVDAGTRRVAYYSHIPPGEYVFSVIAASSDGVWNESAATLAVTIVPPFWRTWWFTLLGASLVIAVAVFLYTRRISALKRAHAVQEAFSRQLIESQEAERKRIAAELHDSLGQNLLVIKNRAMLAMRTADDGTIEQLNEISSTTDQAIDEVSEISYNLRPYHLDRLGLTRAIEAMLRRVSESSGITFSSDVDQIDRLFDQNAEISIYRIVQESVNNIVKHSGATEARVTIKKNGREIQIEIRDNGHGINREVGANDSRNGGFGLIGIAERARMLGGRHSLQSAASGTIITVNIDLPEGKNDD